MEHLKDIIKILNVDEDDEKFGNNDFILAIGIARNLSLKEFQYLRNKLDTSTFGPWCYNEVGSGKGFAKGRRDGSVFRIDSRHKVVSNRLFIYLRRNTKNE